MLYILYKYILVFNHFSDEITLIELLERDEISNLNKIESLINQRNFANYNFFTKVMSIVQSLMKSTNSILELELSIV